MRVHTNPNAGNDEIFQHKHVRQERGQIHSIHSSFFCSSHPLSELGITHPHWERAASLLSLNIHTNTVWNQPENA